jgi:hypothetical protein
MPMVSEMIRSKYLRKEDVEDDIVLTVKEVRLEEMPGDEGEKRWVLSFREIPKGLVLNTTLIRMLEKTHGRNSDDWLGKKVILFVDPSVQFKGQTMGGLRLRPVKPPKATATPAPAAAAEPGLDDDVKKILI